MIVELLPDGDGNNTDWVIVGGDTYYYQAIDDIDSYGYDDNYVYTGTDDAVLTCSIPISSIYPVTKITVYVKAKSSTSNGISFRLRLQNGLNYIDGGSVLDATNTWALISQEFTSFPSGDISNLEIGLIRVTAFGEDLQVSRLWAEVTYATNTVIRPIGDDATTGWSKVGGTTYFYEAVDEINADDAATYVYGSNYTDVLTFTFPDVDLGNSLISKIIVHHRSRSAASDQYAPRIIVGSDYTEPKTLDPATIFTDYTDEYLVNPLGNPWTQSDINNLKVGFRCTGGGPSSVHITQVYVEIVYQSDMILRPNGDYLTTGWIKSGGTFFYEAVDEINLDADDWVKSSVTYSEIIFTVENAPVVYSKVESVSIVYTYQGNVTHYPRLYVGSNYVEAVNSGGYGTITKSFEFLVNPSGGNWSIDDVNNIKFGFKRSQSSTTLIIEQCYLVIKFGTRGMNWKSDNTTVIYGLSSLDARAGTANLLVHEGTPTYSYGKYGNCVDNLGE